MNFASNKLNAKVVTFVSKHSDAKVTTFASKQLDANLNLHGSTTSVPAAEATGLSLQA